MHLTDAEWKIMRVLWAKSPQSAREVLDGLHGEADWAYTTVKTMLTRLVDKKAVELRKERSATVYVPMVTQDEARHTAVDSLLSRAFDGAFGPLMHFLVRDTRLSPRQREKLERILGELEKE